jgi:hypothetical protein
VDSDPPQFGLSDADTGQFPTNLEASTIGERLWIVPDLTLTGVVNLVVKVSDNLHPPDSQHFTLTIVPKPDAPTMTILPKSGTLISGTSSNDDRITITGSLAFNSSSDHTFTFQDLVVLDIGDPAGPLHVTLRPDSPGFAAKNGVIKFKSSGGSQTNVTGQFSSQTGSFKIGVSKFDFPVAISNQVQVGITVGNDYGTDTRAWIESTKKPGTFTLPKP